MALDTRTKRASALGVARPWIRTKEPDAAKGEDWRAASANSYGGNALTPSGVTFQAAWATRATQVTQGGT